MADQGETVPKRKRPQKSETTKPPEAEPELQDSSPNADDGTPPFDLEAELLRLHGDDDT